MKKLFIIGIMTLFLFSCNNEGDVQVQPKHITLSNGKQITVTKICPCDDCDYIWVAYARDSSDVITINHKNSQSHTEKVIINVPR